MKGNKFLALLRGVNIGGNRVIRKEELCALFAAFGCHRVRSYIQSGNILFDSDDDVRQLTAMTQQTLSAHFKLATTAVVISRRQYQSAVASAPADWGADPQLEHHALFVLGNASPQKLLAQLPPPKTDLETVAAGKRAIFWSANRKRLSQTTLTKLVSSPAYKQTTMRSHRTVFKLLALLKGDE